MTTEFDVALPDGRTVHGYDAGGDGVPMFWHHAAGSDHLEEHLASTDFDPDMFTATDHDTLAGAWGWLGSVAGVALDGGLDGMVDDDLAFVHDWGFDPARVRTPVLLVQGATDRIVPPAHAHWLAAHLPPAALQVVDGAGHVSVMAHAADACRWLAGLE